MAPQQYLDSILSNGFRNLHETKYGGGVEDLSIRTSVELTLSGMTKEQFQELPNKWKPKYAMLWPEVNSSLRNDYIPRYGDFAFILKEENLRDRMTWSALDSYDLIKDRHYKDLAAGQVIKSSELNWYQQFIPMSRIDLAAIFIHEFDKVQMSDKSYNRVFMPKEIEFAGKTLYFNPPNRANTYLEFQLWIDIKPTDIKAIVFLGEPPSKENLKKLQDLSIEVYDGRKGHRVPWTGEPSQ